MKKAAVALILQEGLKSALYYRKLLEEISKLEESIIPITAFTSNKSVFETLQSTRMLDDKHLRIDNTAISAIKNNYNVQVKRCPPRKSVVGQLYNQTRHGTAQNSTDGKDPR